jgi:hypothetical protein
MIKVFFLIFEPNVAWEKIAQARRGIVFITATYLLPFLLLVAAAESWGLSTHGKWQPRFEKFKEFPQQEIITYEAVQFFLLLAVVFISALLVFKISQTFQGRQPFLPSFTVVAYGFSPMFLFRLLDAGATVHPATTWCLGMVLTVWILYQGIPRVMQPDPTHAFGIYLSAMFVVVLTSGLARLITGMYLLGYMDFHHSWLSRKIAHLLGQ